MIARAEAISQILFLITFSITSSSKNPTIAAGIVATTKYQNIFPLVVFFLFFISLMAPINKFHQSLKKITSTAIIVPKWRATSNASDDSSQPNK